MIQIPNYRDALDRHETPLDIFVSRWEPVNASDKKTFREDLAALIAYIESAQQGAQRTAERDAEEARSRAIAYAETRRR